MSTQPSASADPLRNNRFDARMAGWSAIGAGVLAVPIVGLYFVHSGPPPASNVLTRNLIQLVFIAVLMVFAVALAPVLRRAETRSATLAGQMAITSLLVYSVVILIAISLEVGTVLQYPDGSVDPTTDGPLAAAMALAHGAIAHLFLAIFLAALAYASGSRGVRNFVPQWTRRGSIAVAGINLAAVPSMYFGMDAKNFYAVNGWGADALVGLISMVWIAAVGVGLVRSARDGSVA